MRPVVRRALVAALVAVAVSHVAPSETRAQAAPSADDRRAAAEAYDRGSSAYLASSFAQAAEWFETAHRLAPAAPALIQAVRAHSRAGNRVRAATLALRLEALYPDDADATAVAGAALAAGSSLVRVDIVCAECTVELDGTLLAHPSFFVEAETDHEVVAHFSTGEQHEQVRGAAGEQREVVLEAPPPQPADPTPPGDPTDPEPGSGGLSPLFVIAAGALTLGAGALLVWSGIDTLAGVDDYEGSPTMEELEAGQSKELRTNVLIGVTAGLGVATAVLAIFTDWGGGDEGEAPAATTVSAGPIAGGGMAVVEGRF